MSTYATKLYDLDQRFDYHAPNDETRRTHQILRENVKAFAEVTLTQIPEGREASLFLTNLEQASFWAHAAIARNQNDL